MGDDYVEEITDKDGNHTRKEVHKHNGVTEVTISGDGAMKGGIAELLKDSGMPLPPPEILSMMNAMGGGFGGASMGGTVTVSGGMMGGPVKKTV